MSAIAADTWGIPGPYFLVLYPVIVIGAALAVVELRRRSERSADTAGPPLTAVEIAYVREGEHLAVSTALGALLASGAVDDRARPTGTGSPHDPLERAILHALADAGSRRDGRRVDGLLEDTRVAAVIDEVRAGLETRGLVRDRTARRRAQAWTLLAWAAVVVGFARMVAGSDQGKPIGFVLLETMCAFFVALLLPMTLGPVRAASRLVDETKRTHDHLDPKLRPSWTTYGASGAGLSVALFGTAALALAAPSFAKTVASRSGGGDSASSTGGDGGGGDSGGCGG